MFDDDTRLTDIRLPDIRSEDHKRALRERGAPHGTHIKTEDDEMTSRRPDEYGLATVLADLRDEQREAREAWERKVTPPPPNRWSMILTIIGVVVGCLTIIGAASTTLQGYTQLGDRLQGFGDRIVAIDTRVTLLEKDMQSRGHTRDQEISSLAANNSLQDERLHNQAVMIEQEHQSRQDSETDMRRSISDLRTVVTDLAKTLDEMRTDLRVIVDRLQRHGEIDVPEHQAQASQPGRTR